MALLVVVVIVHLLAGLTSAADSEVGTGSPIGICYGPSGKKSSSPSEVVSLCKSFNITSIRLYEPNHSLLEALRGSNIQVMIGVNNEDIQCLAESAETARDWVETNIFPYWPYVRFRYISVGNEAIPGKYAKYVLQAMTNLDLALLQNIKASIIVSTAIATSASMMNLSDSPSSASFRKDIEEYIIPIVRFLKSFKKPLLANVHPYFAFVNENYGKMPIHQALSYPGHNVLLRDGEFEYKILFDVLVDALYVSLEKIGGSGIKIVVSETGWPWKGNTWVADIMNAHMYYKNTIRHVSQNDGTPRHRGRIETYLFAMFDEVKKSGDDGEKHWRLFNSDMELVHDISFD